MTSETMDEEPSPQLEDWQDSPAGGTKSEPKISLLTSESEVSSDEPSSGADGLRRQSSVSELASSQSSDRITSPSWLRWVEWPFKVKALSTGSQLPEATAWAMDACGRAPINQAGAYLGTAILRLATEDAGCLSPALCTETVYGLKPSSLLTAASAIVGVVGALTLPIIGAIVDHTRFRKHVGIASAVIILVITGVQISVSLSNWFIMLVLEAVGGYSLLVHTTTLFAYLADLTTVDSDLAHYTSRFNVLEYCTQVFYVSILIIATQIRGASNTVDSSVRTARDALGIALGIALPLFSYAWIFLFRKRGPLSQVPEGSNLATAGIVQLSRTTKKIWNKYSSLKWFMISMLWSPEAGAGVVLSIATTFLVAYLGVSSLQLALLSLVVLGTNVPGSIFAKWMCMKVNPLNSYRLALLYFAASIAFSVVILSGPDMKNWTYLVAVLWGFAFGWVYPSQRVLYVTLIPKGQEMEMMGIFAFSGHLLGWLPPLIFTLMNEGGVDLRWGASLNAFFISVSLLCLIPVGNYNDAVAQVAEQETQEATVDISDRSHRHLP